MVAPSTSAPTRSGCRSAISWAIMPPIDIPYTWARAIPAASSTATASAAMSATENGPGRSGLAARAAVVEADDPQRAGEHRDGAPPRGAGEPEAHHEQDRRPLADRFEVELGIAVLSGHAKKFN